MNIFQALMFLLVGMSLLILCVLILAGVIPVEAMTWTK